MSNHSTPTSQENSAKTLIQAFNDNPIVIHRIYLKLTKDYATAAALAQIFYWHKKMGRSFYKTDSDFMEELCLTVEQFKRVKNNLKKISFLKIELKGIPAKTFYDVDYEVFALEIRKIELQTIDNNRLGENPQTGLEENENSKNGLKETKNPQTSLGENPQTGVGENPQTGVGENPQTNTKNTQRIHRDNNNKEFVAVAANEKTLTKEESDCLEWAKRQAFWSSKVYSQEAFLKLYNTSSQALKGQFENWLELNRQDQVPKKAKVPEIWERAGFKSMKEYNDFQFNKQMEGLRSKAANK